MYKIVDKFVKMNQIYKTLFYVTSFTINISFYVNLQRIVTVVTQMLVKYGLWGFMKSNLTKSVVVLAGFALLYVLTRIPLAHVGERVVSCDSYAAAAF